VLKWVGGWGVFAKRWGQYNRQINQAKEIRIDLIDEGEETEVFKFRELPHSYIVLLLISLSGKKTKQNEWNSKFSGQHHKGELWSKGLGCRGQSEIKVNLILIKKLSKKGKAKGDIFKKTKSKKKEQS